MKEYKGKFVITDAGPMFIMDQDNEVQYLELWYALLNTDVGVMYGFSYEGVKQELLFPYKVPSY